jgi:hypothetical protein
LITWYDVLTGGRVELSVTTAANWVAKIAGYVADELDTYGGDPIIIDPTLHWITAVTLLAVWETGAQVETDVSAAGERLEVPLDPMGGGLSALVAAYPDSYPAVHPTGEDALTAAQGTVPAAARVLTTLPLTGSGLGWGLLGPLAAGGSVVYAPDDHAAPARAAAERATHTVGLAVAGLPRLD